MAACASVCCIRSAETRCTQGRKGRRRIARHGCCRALADTKENLFGPRSCDAHSNIVTLVAETSAQCQRQRRLLPCTIGSLLVSRGRLEGDDRSLLMSSWVWHATLLLDTGSFFDRRFRFDARCRGDPD